MGRKNNMKTPKEKEKIVKEYLSGVSATTLADKYNISRRPIYHWVNRYQKNGLKGLKSETGKSSKRHKHTGLYLRKPKTREDELEIELIKKEIEIARLKKGYQVKGVGAEKEYDTTFDVNMK